MLTVWEREYPGRKMNIFRSLSSVVPSHLADNKLYNFCEIDKEKGISLSSPVTGWSYQK